MRKNKKAFTLIELVAVLVILAIIALIVTPLVMNIVKKAKDSANRRSVDAYGKAVELAVTSYLLDNGDYPTDISSLTIEYSGNEVVCNTQRLNEDGSIYLSGCSVNGRDVKDSKEEDGYYHYGKTSAGAYQAYNVGDIVTYNGMNFYVIENSDEASDRVTLLKAEPLTADEVNTYGVGHINNYSEPAYVGNVFDNNGYGEITYYTSSTCGYINGSWVTTGCTIDYDVSDVKYVVDAWAKDKLNESDLKEDILGYNVRLLTVDEYMDNAVLEETVGVSDVRKEYYAMYDWMIVDCEYWTMSGVDDSNRLVYYISSTRGSLSGNYIYGEMGMSSAIRPVITLSKDVI